MSWASDRKNPGPPSDITAALELSRRGVQRNLSALVDREWIERNESEYRLTTVGRLVASHYTDVLGVLVTIERCELFFAHLPDRDHAPNPNWLTDAEVVVADSSHPYAPMKYHAHIVHTCSTGLLRSLVPTLRRFHTIIYGGVPDRGIETELVLPRAVATLAGAEHPAEFEAALRLDTLDLCAYNGMVGLGLTLTDQGAIVSAYDGQGRLRACMHGTNPALRG